MRTKTLILAAVAALGVGIYTSQAAVTSANIVGYANIVLPATPSYSLIVAPMVGTNTAADTLLTCLQPGDAVLIWTGAGYYSDTFYGPGTGPNGEAWYDSNNNFTNAPAVPPGTGFFYQNNQGVNETNTFVGTVQLTNHIVLSGTISYSLVGSTPPIGGSIDATNMNFGLPLQPGDAILVWTGNGYYSDTYYGPGTGPNGEAWYDSNNNFTNAPIVSVGQGFFYQNNQGSDENWNQNLIVQ